ncbi:hypothetical protein O9993_15210 [Vibrio lentus]|nr:hypothetical protein [Vibrio lentus]
MTDSNISASEFPVVRRNDLKQRSVDAHPTAGGDTSGGSASGNRHRDRRSMAAGTMDRRSEHEHHRGYHGENTTGVTVSGSGDLYADSVVSRIRTRMRPVSRRKKKPMSVVLRTVTAVLYRRSKLTTGDLRVEHRCMDIHGRSTSDGL